MRRVVFLCAILLFAYTSHGYAAEQYGAATVEYDQFKNRVTVSVSRQQMINTTTAISIRCDRNFDMSKYETYKKAKDSYGTEPAMLTFLTISTTEFYHFANTFDYIIGTQPGESITLTKLSNDYDRSRRLFSTAAFCVIKKDAALYQAINNKVSPIIRINFLNKPPYTCTFVENTLEAINDVLTFDIVQETEKRLNSTRKPE